MFEKGVRAKQVVHPGRFLLELAEGLPEAVPADEAVARAEWLVGKVPRGKYNLVGSNCEHLANWCVTAWYFESLQVRAFFALHAAVGWLLLVNMKRLHRRWLLLWLATCVGPPIYQGVPYLQWRDILMQWPHRKSSPEGRASTVQAPKETASSNSPLSAGRSEHRP